VTEDTESVVLQ